MQEILGICSICRRSAPLHTCPLCGKQVCNLCTTPRGMCIDCARGRMMD